MVDGSRKTMSGHIPQLIATAGPMRIEKVSGGYQLWNDYRFIAFFFDLRDAENRMERVGGVRPCWRAGISDAQSAQAVLGNESRFPQRCRIVP
jgi:hypothetical protein